MKCKRYEECLRYTEMTLDWTALNCKGCPAYKKSNIPRSLKYLLRWLR